MYLGHPGGELRECKLAHWELSRDCATAAVGVGRQFKARASNDNWWTAASSASSCPLADVYPKPYTAVVIWATDDLVADDPSLVGAFVRATLESVKYVKENPDHAADLVATKKNVPKAVAARIVAELTKVLVPSGRGSGQDLAAAVEGNWRFTKESGTVPPETAFDVSDAVRELGASPRFTPPVLAD